MPVRAKNPRTLLLTSLAHVPARARLLPSLTVLIYDRRLERVSPEFRRFARQFPFRYGVTSGEALKDIAAFPDHCAKLSKLAATLPARSMTVVSAGGGSVGDFAGFFASVYKRGVRLVHLPTTWLAAIDSSHGGKTALNVGGAKNQIGTFYSADTSVMVHSVLNAAPSQLAFDAFGELAKIAIIDGGPWVRRLEHATGDQQGRRLWTFLGPAIAAKMKIVRRDPREERGVRQVLNLGHTMGHVFEASLGLSHGAAVAQGLFFALEFSRQRGVLAEPAYERALSLMAGLGLAPMAGTQRPIAAATVSRLLMADKKRDRAGAVTFVFVRRFGRCERRAVRVVELVQEARRQGWVR